MSQGKNRLSPVGDYRGFLYGLGWVGLGMRYMVVMVTCYISVCTAFVTLM